MAQVDDDYETSALSERAKAVLQYTDVFLTDPAGIPPAVRARIRAHLEPPEIVELTLILGAFAGFAKLRIALGLVPAADAAPPDGPLVVPTPGSG